MGKINRRGIFIQSNLINVHTVLALNQILMSFLGFSCRLVLVSCDVFQIDSDAKISLFITSFFNVSSRVEFAEFYKFLEISRAMINNLIRASRGICS